MAIPDYQSIMLPLLAALADGRERAAQDLVEELAKDFKLTEQERNEMLPSGRARLFRNRVGWATTYLKKASLVASPKRGRVLITAAGSKVLTEKPRRIDNVFLERFESFVAFRELRHEKSDGEVIAAVESNTSTPFEELELAYSRIRAELQDELLEQVKGMTPRFITFFVALAITFFVARSYPRWRHPAAP